MTKDKKKTVEVVEKLTKSVKGQREKPMVDPGVRRKKDPQLMMTFNRWFAIQGRLAHHKAGMKAFTNVKGKRSVTAWNRLFSEY